MADWECHSCYRSFPTFQRVAQHMNDTNHWDSDRVCNTCSTKFFYHSRIKGHYDETGHEFYCLDCERSFQNQNNLNMHRNSRIHRGNSVTCPFCQRGFTSASGLSHHLETNSCPNKDTNRQGIYRFIRGRDRTGFVTKNLLEWHDNDTAETWATDNAYNGEGWECYLCNREFCSKQGLNQHLNSPAHMSKIYHCPSRTCNKEFVTLAALFNHLESESCGFTKFTKVQRSVDGFFNASRAITF